MRWRGVAWLVAGAATALPVPACTVLSGWHDLQDGQRTGDAGGNLDGSVGPAPTVSVMCATMTCMGGQVCCNPANAGASAALCLPPSSCTPPAYDQILCTSSAQCAASYGASAACCFSGSLAACARGCGDASALCSPANVDECPPGTSCRPLTALEGYYSCQ